MGVPSSARNAPWIRLHPPSSADQPECAQASPWSGHTRNIQAVVVGRCRSRRVSCCRTLSALLARSRGRRRVERGRPTASPRRSQGHVLQRNSGARAATDAGAHRLGRGECWKVVAELRHERRRGRGAQQLVGGATKLFDLRRSAMRSANRCGTAAQRACMACCSDAQGAHHHAIRLQNTANRPIGRQAPPR